MPPPPSDPNIEPELQAPVPRKLGFNLGTRLTRWLLALLLLGLLTGAWVLVVVEHHEIQLLLREGRTAGASVTHRRKYSGRSTDYYLDYTFSAGGRSYEGSESVNSKTYYHTAIGDPLTVTYLPSDPNIERVGKVDASTLADQRQVEWVVLGFLTPVLLGIAWYCEHFFRRRLWLLRCGTAVRAEILEWSRTQASRIPQHYITVAFDGPTGERLTQTIAVASYLGQNLVEQEAATVLYNPQKPQESHFYVALNPARPKAETAEASQRSAAGV